MIADRLQSSVRPDPRGSLSCQPRPQRLVMEVWYAQGALWEVVLYQTDFQLHETESCKDCCSHVHKEERELKPCVKVIHVQQAGPSTPGWTGESAC